MNRVKCIFVPDDPHQPIRGLEIEPYKGAHEIFNAIIESSNGTVARASRRDGTLLWIDDETVARRANPRATAIAGQPIVGHAVVFRVENGEMTDVRDEILGLVASEAF
jgi:hypothetical protein